MQDIAILILLLLLIVLLFYLRGKQDHKTLGKGQVRIILPTVVIGTASGLSQDAEIYHRLIPNSYIVQVDRNSPELHPDAQTPTLVNLYLESLIAPETCFPCQERWLMVNQEFYFPKYTLQVDVLLAKTYYAERLLKEYITKIGAPTQVVYLGHTSLVEERGSSEKDWQLCVHFAGNSRYKGTNRLIRMWQAEGGFRKIAPKSRLVITCRDLCHHKIGVELSSLEYDGKGKYHDPRTGLEIYSYLPLEELQRLRQRAGLFLCPSLVEGYGHYINEGAANGSVVITTDFPPMHELVPRNKYLVPPVEIYSSWHVFEPFGFLEPYFIDKHLSTSQAATADMSALASILKDYFLLPTREKEILAETYKEHYRLRREDFETRLGAFLEETRNCSHKS